MAPVRPLSHQKSRADLRFNGPTWDGQSLDPPG